MTVVYAIILFVLMIFPHELGHFTAAKAVGVRVNEFSFGMGPALFQRQKGETLYSVRLIPLGGYCAMESELEEGDDGESTGDDRSFGSRPVWAKLIVLAAGSFMNVLIAVLVLSIFAGAVGAATTSIGEVQDSSPAMEAGLQAGDRLISINGTGIETWSDVSGAIGSSDGSCTVSVMRDGEELTLTVVPVSSEDGRMVIGITPKASHNVFTAVRNGAKMTWNMTVLMFDSLGQLLTGGVSTDEITGPVGIVNMAGQTSRYGISYFVYLVALMSLNLAIVNMLPVPALDGGRILLVIIRRLTGKMISDKVENAIHGAGMLLLLGLMVFVTWNDITRLLL
ncbi:MAG: RIP metalloprotease RseP [Emergencia sp.]